MNGQFSIGGGHHHDHDHDHEDHNIADAINRYREHGRNLSDDSVTGSISSSHDETVAAGGHAATGEGGYYSFLATWGSERASSLDGDSTLSGYKPQNRFEAFQGLAEATIGGGMMRDFSSGTTPIGASAVAWGLTQPTAGLAVSFADISHLHQNAIIVKH